MAKESGRSVVMAALCARLEGKHGSRFGPVIRSVVEADLATRTSKVTTSDIQELEKSVALHIRSLKSTSRPAKDTPSPATQTTMPLRPRIAPDTLGVGGATWSGGEEVARAGFRRAVPSSQASSSVLSSRHGDAGAPATKAPKPVVTYKPKPGVALPCPRPYHLQRLQGIEAGYSGKSLWDLIIRYDQHMYNLDEQFRGREKPVLQKKYRNSLDEQMREVNDRQRLAALEKGLEREAMQMELARAKRDEGDEHAAEEAKQAAVRLACAQAQEVATRKRQRELKRQAKERERLLEQVKKEEAEDQRKEKEKREEFKQRNEDMLKHLEEAVHLRKERRRAEAEEEVRMAKIAIAEMDQREAKRAAELEAMKERMKGIARTVGKQIGDDLEARARQDEERMLAAVREAEVKAKEKEETTRALVQKRTRDLRDTLNQQMEMKRERQREEGEASKLQGRLWKQQALEAEQQERDEAAERKRQRSLLDSFLVEQIKWQASVPLDDRMSPHLFKRELEFNQNIVRRILQQGSGFDAEDALDFTVQRDPVAPQLGLEAERASVPLKLTRGRANILAALAEKEKAEKEQMAQ